MEYYDDNDKEYKEVDGENKPQPKQTNNMAVISMVCGIIGVLALCCCIAFPLSIILGVAAICLSCFSRKGKPFSGYAIAGLVLGIISLLLGVAEGFYIIAINFMLRDPNMAPIFDQLIEQYNAT